MLTNPNYINYLYSEAEKKLLRGYRLYHLKQFLETFVLFMQVTKIYELICMNNHLIISNKRHLQLKKDILKILPILESIKPQLIKKYGKVELNKTSYKLPSVPTENNEISIPIPIPIPIIPNTSDENNDEQLKLQLSEELEQRWNKIMPQMRPSSNEANESKNIGMTPISNLVHPNISQPIAKKHKSEINSKPKTTDDINKLTVDNQKFKYINADGTPLDSLSILSMHLSAYNLEIKNVPGDNNCQFHAVADQLDQINIKEWNDVKLRKKAVQWLKDNGDRPMDDGKIGERTLLKDAVGVVDWNKYTEDMSQRNKTWGDEATLLALSVLFKMEIIIISSLPKNYSHSIKPPELWGIELQNKIYLGHYHEFHYVSTKSK